MVEITKEDELEIIRLYDIERYTLRRIAKLYNTDHHRIKRILEKHNVQITSHKERKQIPMSEETKMKIGNANRGKSRNVGRKMPISLLYVNMQKHLKYNVPLDFLKEFEIDKLKTLNSVIKNTRVSKHFNSDKYMEFVNFFYYDEGFNFTYNNWIKEGKKKYAKPSLDHIIPLSKGGTWDIDNLQIIPWCINRAKFNYLINEWEHILQRYFMNGGDFYRRQN